MTTVGFCEYCGGDGEIEFVDLFGKCEQWECVWCGALFDLNCVEDDDDTPLGDDGYPLDMDDETKAWLRTNR